MFLGLNSKKALTAAAVCVGACIMGGPAFAQTQNPVYFEVTNFTNAGGNPYFPVVSDLNFTNLSLTETFADHFQQTVALYLDPTDASTQQNSLNTQDFVLTSGTFSDPSSTHGALVQAILTGNTDQSLLQVQTAINGPSSFVPASTSISANLFGPDPGRIGVGTLSEINANTQDIIARAPIEVTPEGSSLSLFATCGLGVLATLGIRRRNRK